jgi:hypothetical protein
LQKVSASNFQFWHTGNSITKFEVSLLSFDE